MRNGLEFRNLDTLFGYTIRTGQLVISNEAMSDARRGGLPKDHPRLERYLGIPIYPGSKFLGMASLEQRPSDLAELIRWADNATYAAKSAGRNRVHLHAS